MWEAFHGRSAAYAAAWDDPKALAEAIGRNLWRGADAPNAAAVARIALGQSRHLEAQGLEAMLRGEVHFLSAEDAAR